MLVLDASAAVRAALERRGFEPIAPLDLVAPPIMWSEATSVLHELVWRRAIAPALGERALTALLEAPVRRRAPARLPREAWDLADTLGWARTYDAEYVALARLLRCRLLTVDARLRRGAAGLVDVVGPTEL